MPFYKVTKTFKYTETVYMESETKQQAEDDSGENEGSINYDDQLYDSCAKEITEDEFKEETD